MPGKYSHTVVLATYSSRGILNFPSNQKSNAECNDRSGTSSSSVPKSRNGESTAVNQASAATPSLSTPHQLKRQQKQASIRKSTESSNTISKQARRGSYGHRSGVAAQTPAVSSHGQDSQPYQSAAGIKPWSKPKPGLFGTDPSENDPWVIPWQESHQPRADVAEDGVAGSRARSKYSHAHHYEPRPDVRPIRKHELGKKTKKHVEPLLSLQQFLDLLPPLNEGGPQMDRKSMPYARSSSSKPVSLLPAFRPVPARCDSAPALQGRSSRLDPARPPPRTAKSSDSYNRGATSFIDSSDDEDEEEEEEEPGLEKLYPRHVSASTSSAKHDHARSPFPAHHEKPISRRKVVDLTKALPELPAMSPPRLENVTNSPSAASYKVQKNRSKRHSRHAYESDASDEFPLQRHSPLPKLRSATIHTADLADSTAPIFEMPDNQVQRKADDPRTGTSSSRSNLQNLDLGTDNRQSTISRSSDTVDFEEYLNDPSIIGQPHVHQRYYRTTEDETSKSDILASIFRLMSPTSFDRGQSHLSDVQGRIPTSPDAEEPLRSTRTSSVAPDMPERTPPEEIRSKTPPIPLRNSRRLTPPTEEGPGVSAIISSKPVNPTPHFGTLSVVRDPEEKAMLNVQNLSRSTTPLPAAETKTSPQKFLQIQRHLLRSSSDLTSIKNPDKPESTRRGSYTSLGSPERVWKKSPEIKTPSSADFGDDGWGRVSIEPARSTRNTALFEPWPVRGHDIVEKRGRCHNHDEEDAALPPPNISRRRPGEDEFDVAARSQSRGGVLGKLMKF
ncbi:uncharacterized protein PV06_02046 [Exophiala oligosperma]|uniref:Uncharacterized protein n=2 Tax=Chaetothyriales TaxID=34395 RepID=A0A0D2B2F6_9EURO|nr:uncharacterized protein PV06_02046 [Exophiala oligosperma]KAJ9646226.1 hypothetical protein H2204_000889 [Knufia peltigerae]KIW46371.1 hypothetical protein PV06_02046 [Exophiala oligosperma]